MGLPNTSQHAIAAAVASSTNSTEKHVEIKCSFGMILSDTSALDFNTYASLPCNIDVIVT
jgi:hypothetical protein